MRSWTTVKQVWKQIFFCAAALLFSSGAPADGATRLLRTPTVSADHIAFAYANNIWIVGRRGGTARRLTSF